jgi:bifunctional DNA-binding transcriptional regulator/antitoxin component of YhaV-PrlF toxin-antitoxin module
MVLMSKQAARVHVSENGRLSLPVAMRRAAGLEKGGTVSVTMDEDGIHIESHRQFIKRIQKMAREDGWHDKTSVDDFLQWRREEAKRDEEEMDRKHW